MSLISIQNNHSLLEDNVDGLINLGLDTISENIATKHDTKILLESLLLRSCAYWERFLEKELVFLVKREPRKFIEYMELPNSISLSSELIRAIMYSDRYKDLHDIKRTKKYCSKILSEKNNLFKNIPSERIKKIEFTYVIRNYLSHYSEFSKKRLRKEYNVNFEYKRFLAQSDGSFFDEKYQVFTIIQ